MTKNEVTNRFVEIWKCRHDDEKAHAKEDALHQDVLQAIAEDNIELDSKSELAEAALLTLKIPFERWSS